MGMLDSVRTWYKPVVIMLVMIPIFFLRGIVISFLMLLTYVLIWPFNRRLYRTIVDNLAYFYWSHMTFIGQWWSGSSWTVYMEDPDQLAKLGHEHCIAIMNHKYDIDWLLAGVLTERLGILGGMKMYGKSSLRLLPILGWIWTFSEMIFVKRDWDKDKKNICQKLQYVREYPKNYWVTLFLMCEGTRFTDEKHRISQDVARKKGLPIMKHHLLPRTKGFVLSVQSLKGTVPSILDLTIGFRSDGEAPTLVNILKGKSCSAEIYIRRIPLDKVPSDSDEECGDWLYKLYQEKDDIYEHFVKNDCFKMGTRVDIPRRLTDLWAFIFWLVFYVPTLYYLGCLMLQVLHGSPVLQLCLVILIVMVFVGTRYLIAETETEKGSRYGKKS